MKHILTTIIFFSWSFISFASDTTILFRQIKYSYLFETAKKENKGVMIYFHFDGCGACVQMERTAFKDKNVIDFYNTNSFYRHFDSSQVKTRIVWILDEALYKASDNKDENTFNQAIEILKEYDTGEEYLFKEMDGRVTGVITNKNLVLSIMLYYYETIGDQSNYLKTLDAYIPKIWNDAYELNNSAWNIFERASNDETEKIKAAIKCSIRSIELDDNYANNDTYAWLLYKSGKKNQALKQADKTIEIAKKNNEDFSETRKLVDTLRTHRR